jgi:hypothetical protein
MSDAPLADAEHRPDLSYGYRASLVGGGRDFALTSDGLAWKVGAKSGLWPYASIAALTLSYRPVSMQSQRFRADLKNVSGERLVLLSTSWQTVALMAPQDADYRAFMLELHRRLAAAGSRVELIGGLSPLVYRAALAVVAVLAIAMTALLARALATEAYAGAAFIVGFAALFAWQIGGFIRRNRPLRYGFDALPMQLLP